MLVCVKVCKTIYSNSDFGSGKNLNPLKHAILFVLVLNKNRDHRNSFRTNNNKINTYILQKSLTEFYLK